MHVHHRNLSDYQDGRRFEFSHIDKDADESTWQPDSPISLDHLKINVFKGGDFSLLIGEKSYTPQYGDIAILPHGTIHYGKIRKKTHTDYYQLDIGAEALFGIAGGGELLSSATEKGALFLRPSPEAVKEVMEAAERVEDSLETRHVAFLSAVLLLSVIERLTKKESSAKEASFSRHSAKVMELVARDYQSKLTVELLAKECKVSRSYLTRDFKRAVGVPLHEYLNDYRITRSLELLAEHSVAETAVLVGFSDSSHYIGVFKRVMGTTPSKYKAKISPLGK